MKNKRFTFLCTQKERDQILELAVILQRSQGDAVRWAIRKAYFRLLERADHTGSGSPIVEGLSDLADEPVDL